MTVLFFTAPYCAPCAAIKDWVIKTVESGQHEFFIYDITKEDGKKAVATFEVLVTPELIILDAQGKKTHHFKSAEEIEKGLEKALGLPSSMKGWLLLGGGILLGGIALYMLSKKKKGIGRIVSSNNSAGRTICRDAQRSTSRGTGTCSYHRGMDKDKMQREYNLNRTLKKSGRLNGTKKRKTVTKK